MKRIALFSLAVIALGCGGGQAPPEAPKADKAADHDADRGGDKPGVEAEIGALDEGKVKQAFSKAAGPMTSCMEKARERVPFLAGEARFALRIMKTGAVRWAYVKESTLGDREVEACMLDALKALSWPKPQGGEGLAESPFTFDPNPDERQPVAWEEGRIAQNLRALKPALTSCRKSAGTGPLRITMHVETNGKPLSVGVAGADDKVEAAASCVVGAVKKASFPSPGSFAAKVSFSVE